MRPLHLALTALTWYLSEQNTGNRISDLSTSARARPFPGCDKSCRLDTCATFRDVFVQVLYSPYHRASALPIDALDQRPRLSGLRQLYCGS